MIRKNYSRRVFLIEVIQNEKVLGYYAGKDWDNSVVIKGLHGAMIIKKEKGVSHIVDSSAPRVPFIALSEYRRFTLRDFS